MAARYIIDGGKAGKARLDVLAAVCAPGTNALFDRVWIRAGARCLDVGCGGGHVTRELANRAGLDGIAVGIDSDATVVSLAESDSKAAGVTNVEFRVGDARQVEPAGYDVVYARCLLSHLDDPGSCAAMMASSLAPGGVVIVEDIDFSGYFCWPPSEAHDYYVTTYRETVRRRGGNADLGPSLPAVLRGAGLESVSVSVSQACALVGEVKLIPPLTLERIGSAAIAEGVADEETLTRYVQQLFAEAADSNTCMGMPRVVQAWGSKPH